MKRKSVIRRLAAFVACTALLLSMSCAAFQDVPDEGELAEAVAVLADNGVVKGVSATDFNPDGKVTGAELSTMLGRAAGVAVDHSVKVEGVADDGWSTGYVAWALEKGILSGADKQSAALTLNEINTALAAFCKDQNVQAVTASSDTRGGIAVALKSVVEGMYVNVKNVQYTTVTTAEDWGPAISKVILNLGTAIDPESVSADSFTVEALRQVSGFDWATMQPTPPAKVSRPVTAAYVCDVNGNKADTGTRVAIEMVIGPDNTEGSPFNYDFASGLNSYVDADYYITLNLPLKQAGSDKKVSMAAVNETNRSRSVTEGADSFVKGLHTYEDITLNYASWTPAQARGTQGTTPLIIWLHGAGEGGSNPNIAIIGNKVVNLITSDIQGRFGSTGAAVLAPQCPTMWMDLDGTSTYRSPANTQSGRSYYTDALKSLIDSYLTEHPEIDTDRIYIGGCSNGGYMTVNMIVEYPDFFAAAYPVCEAYSAVWMTDEMVESIKDLPIWLTHSMNDGTVSIYEGESDPANYMVYNLKLDADGKPIPKDDFSNNLYNRLVAAGAENVHYSLFEDVHDTTGLYKGADGEPYQYMGHWSWIYTLNDACVDNYNGQEVTIFQWMAQQTRAAASKADVGTVTRSAVKGADAYYFVPADFTNRNVESAAVFVYGDNTIYDETSALEFIESNGLAEFAGNNSATVVVFNPVNGVSYSAADVDAYKAVFANYADSSDTAFVNGLSLGTGGIFGTPSGKYPGASVGSDIMVYVVAVGAGADFVNQYLIDGDITTVSGFGMDVLAIPTGVVLFNAAAVPANENDRPVAAALYGCSSAVNSYYRNLNNESKLVSEVGRTTVKTSKNVSAANISEGLESMKEIFRYWVGGRQFSESFYQLMEYPDWAKLGITETAGSRDISTGKIEYRMYAPSSVNLKDADKKVPVLLLFHGGGNSAEFVTDTTRWPLVGKADNLVVVAVDHHVSQDASAVMELVDILFEENPALDASRLYASGFSMGSVKSHALAVEFSERFAAIAPMSAATGLGDAKGAVPYFYVGGETSFLAEAPMNIGFDGKPVDKATFTNFVRTNAAANNVPVPAEDADSDWGVKFDRTEKVESDDGLHTMTKNYLNSEDGTCITVHATTSNMTHATLEFNSQQAWEFMRQFSRGEDGEIRIAG